MKNYVDDYKNNMMDKTYQYSKKYNLKISQGTSGWNDEGDAFRHAFMQASISLKSNSNLANIVGDLHEIKGNLKKGQPSYEENMDKWNNLEGRKIAEDIKKEYGPLERIKLINSGKMDDIIAEKVMEKMKKGELITNPYTDKRKYTENSLMDKIFNLKNRVFHQNEISMSDLDDPQMMDAFLDQALDKEAFPTKEDLDKKVASGELVYVNNYERSDGTKVSGYYRSASRG